MHSRLACGALLVSMTMASCATIVNDANIPLVVSFSDGSAGMCDFRNKRGMWSSEVPTNGMMVRRSDDALTYQCKLRDGRTVSGSIRSEVEGEKMAASIIFWDLGITDAITDKHRTYQGNVVIPVPATASRQANTTDVHDGYADEAEALVRRYRCDVESLTFVSKEQDREMFSATCTSGQVEIECWGGFCRLL